ncbi:hypothetical protein SNOUR_40335 [Streptomyces noursei ATCC 11455]|nr:hypothetical protein SNOUR_40335 [Streptomyces noursei ATCC 11455]
MAAMPDNGRQRSAYDSGSVMGDALFAGVAMTCGR